MSSCSVIICTYNRAHLVKRVLHSLARQTIRPGEFEVVVVDDGSRDNTAEVCNAMHSQLPNLKYISTGRNTGLAHARNIGIAASTGDYLLFTDDDCIAAENWVESLRNALDNKEEMVSGAVASTTANFFRLCHNVAQFHAYMPGQNAGPKEMLAGGNMAFRRSVLKELKGFDEESRCEDTEFVLRAREKGYRAFFAPDALVTHDPERNTLSSAVKYAASHASATIHLRNHYRALLKTPFIFRSAGLILAMAPLIALKVTAGIYLRNPSLARFFWTAPFVYVLKLAWCWGAARGLRNQNSEGKTT